MRPKPCPPQELREYAQSAAVPEEEAAAAGMSDMSAEFRKQGAEVYL